MPRSAHRLQLIAQYPSLVNGDPNFRTSGHVHLGRRIICSRPNNTNISGGLITTRRRKVVKGTIIGFLSESDVDKSGNASFTATKSSQYAREGEPSKLFHIVMDEKDTDNDTVVVDMEEWELDEYCEWIAADKETKRNDGEGQKKQDSSLRRKNAQPKCTNTTEFEKLNNLALEAAASAHIAPAVVEKAVVRANDENATLAEAAAAGCRKCKTELDTGKPGRGPHVGHCPRNSKKKIDSSSCGKSEEKLQKNDKGDISRDVIVVEKAAIGRVDDGKATLADGAAAGCKKCINELATGKKAKGPHVGNCPRWGLWKSEENVDKSEKGDKTSDNADSQSSKKKIDDSSSKGTCENEGRPKQNQTRRASAPSPSFNDILKSAVASYASNTQKKYTINPPPSMPPPFLSHEENCTLRTALAFAMAKARNKGKINNNTSLPRGSTSHAVENAEGKRVSADRLGEGIQTNGLGSHHHSPLVGGLLALPPRTCPSIGQMNLNASNTKIELDRELKHVRDVMNLAVSTLLPLYKSTLQLKSDERPGVNGQSQCAVYDYESAGKPSSLRGCQFQLPASGRHLASLDGLCRHIIARLSSIVNDKALRRKLRNQPTSAMMPNSLSQDDHAEFSNNAETNAPEVKTDIVRNAVAQLQMDFMIDTFRHSSDPAQQIHQIMASCHVLHRLLLLDENCTIIGSDCVAMACTILTDLYHNKRIGGRDDGGSNQLRQMEGFRQAQEHDGKGKHQVATSRWSYPASSYNTNREERRKQALCAISQRCNSNGPLTGMKRSANQSYSESDGYQPIQLPRLGDVLAVNLLRLLEGASAVRLHFHRRYAGNNGHAFASKAATSAAAAEVLQEVRTNTDHDLLMPIHINDAATVYYHEKMNSQERCVGTVDHLRPGAKMMLRIHLFGLTQKLSMYEQG